MSACISPTIHGGSTLEWARLAARGLVRYRLGPLPYRARGGVLLPVIGSSYGRWRGREIEPHDAPKAARLYFEHRLPIAPERYSEILRSVVREAGPRQRRESVFSHWRHAIRACGIPTQVSPPSAELQASTAVLISSRGAGRLSRGGDWPRKFWR
jgi:hypothetical protein